MTNESWWRQLWSHRSPMAWLLWPLSLVHAAIHWARLNLYRWGWMRSHRAQVPVLVVGNVFVGGVGKTPVVIELVRQLQHRGWHIGVISRGYGRSHSKPQCVMADSRAEEVGDEPLLIHRLTGCPVAVGPHRAELTQMLLTQHPQINLIISDDGLQHLALQHDVALCLFDCRRLGNGWMLPAGPLREPWPRQVPPSVRQWVLSTESPPWHGAVGVLRSLSSQAVNGHGHRRALSDFRTPVHALAAIAQPEVFFGALKDAGLHLAQSVAYSDHDSLGHWHSLPGETWLCTEKDAVKLWPMDPEVWAVPLDIGLDAAWLDEVDAELHTRLSSRHGH